MITTYKYKMCYFIILINSFSFVEHIYIYHVLKYIISLVKGYIKSFLQSFTNLNLYSFNL